MNILQRLQISLLLILPILLGTTKPTHPTLSNKKVAQQLRWISTPISPCFRCGGYFFEPKFISKQASESSYQNTPITITAQGPTLFSKIGLLILKKSVHIKQKGRDVLADKAYVYHNKATGKIKQVKLIHNVRIQEHNKYLVSDKAILNLKTKTASLQNAVFHIRQKDHQKNHNAWGTAREAQYSNARMTLTDASYSTCSPLNPHWQLNAKQITLNTTQKKGKAKNAVLRIYGIPVLYTPYLSFSMNKQRKSGLLTPIIENSSKSGFHIGLPYYWNMASNYDMTLTPGYFTKRGFQLNLLFRYLSKTSQGNLYTGYLPKDHAFQDFKDINFIEFPEPIDPFYQPYINQLRKSHNNRGYIAFNDHTQFNTHWSSNIQINYATDPYYLRDFGTSINQVIANQLLNQFDLHYQDTHWNLTLLMQAFQTLHLITQSNHPAVNQYKRLPELDTAFDYPSLFDILDFNLNAQAINFAYHSNFPPQTNEMPAGQRLHLRPTLSHSFYWASGYLTPSLRFDSTFYHVSRPQGPQTSHSSRHLPIANIDTGLYFSRPFTYHQTNYLQTLEPRLFYLYVPFENQDRYPLYDTQLLPFTYDQLFSVNQFTGFDRLQNANQISLGLTSHILKANATQPLIKWDIGSAYYLDSPNVCLTTHCNTTKTRWAPLASNLIYHPTPHWGLSTNLAWNIEKTQINNVQFNIAYTRDGQHIIGTGYTFVHSLRNENQLITQPIKNSSALYSAYIAWPFNYHWSVLGYLYYNISQKRPENYFVGLQYDTCCFSFRMIIDRSYLGRQIMPSHSLSANQYSTNYIFQIQLKGLGSAGNANSNALLRNSIPGYIDPFKY